MAGLTVNNSIAPIELDDVWQRWLGTLETDAFRNSGLVILARIDRVGVAPNQGEMHERLERRARLFHYALVMQGCAYNDGALMVQGNTIGGHLHIGPISRGWTPCYRPDYRRLKRITPAHIRRAGVLLANLERIYDHVPNPDYRRLRKGFNAWIKGVESNDVGERLHAFVRATEAIIRATTRSFTHRKISQTFRTRGQTFIGVSRRSESLLRQLYDLRSCIEHVKDILHTVRKPRGVHRDEAIAFRALQAEILASDVFERILANEHIRERLRTEIRVEGFWRRTPTNRTQIWGRSIDINRRARREFRSAITVDIL